MRVTWGRESQIRREEKDTRVLARMSTEAPRVPWDVFTKNLNWEAGQHFALIGPTGQGKTTMLTNLLPLHPFVVVTATKPRDDTMERLIATGYLRMDRWRSLDPIQHPRRVLWPDAKGLHSEEKQKEVFLDAMNRIYREGGWTFAVDELWYFTNILKLERQIKVYLLQARALDISVLVATQRPSAVPLEIYDQSTHLMFWRDNDEVNLKRLSGIGSKSSDLIREIVSNLDPFQVLYINTRTGYMARTKCPDIKLPTVERR